MQLRLVILLLCRESFSWGMCPLAKVTCCLVYTPFVFGTVDVCLLGEDEEEGLQK